MSTFIGSLPERKSLCKATFSNCDKTVECKPFTNLRELAIEHDIDLYNGLAKYVNCQGHGACGTCTVEVIPQEGVTKKGALENLRFIQLKGNLRLSCQVSVTGDIVVRKHAGFMGTKDYEQVLSREEIARLYTQEGKTLAEIAGHFKCPVPKIVNILEKAGVEMRRPGSAA